MLDILKREPRERMSNVDVAWLRMDRSTNLMMIAAVLIFDDKLDFDRFKKTVEQRMLNFKRFKQKVVELPNGVFWETDTNFDIDMHVVLTALPGKAGKKELQGLTGQLIGTPLDPTKPRWQFHVIEQYEGNCSAAIARIDHCYADGMALMSVLQSMTDTAPNVATLPVKAPMKYEGNSSIFNLQRLIKPLENIVENAVSLGKQAAEEASKIINAPSAVLDYAKIGADILNEILKVTFLSSDSETRYKGKLSVVKRCAWSDPINLDEVKHMGKVMDCTINDVLLACISGSLRSYLVEQGDEVADNTIIRASVPVNLRSVEELASGVEDLGNKFGLVFMTLPVGVENPIERLYTVKQNMLDIKNSMQAQASSLMLGLVGFAPSFLQAPMIDMFAKKASAVMSNVPGPRQPVYLAGAKVSNQMFWVPQSGDIGMGVSILSYDGSVQFGLVTDANLVPDPENVIARFADEFEKLLLITLMEESWDKPFDPKKVAASLRAYEERMVAD